ncbi:MAG: hypothetical protein NC240_01240 [Clostridium sp.]|nr:hypothetical protein [Clostridium sp.]
MFRCITDLRGLVIDIDSFGNISIEDWRELFDRYHCLFLTSNEENSKKIAIAYGKKYVYQIEPFIKLFAPSPMTHKTVLEIMNLKPTEIAYVSQNSMFLENAMGFMGGTIWVTDKVSYESASKSPDLICREFNSFKKLVLKGVKGFLGEVVIFPNEEMTGMIIPLLFKVDDEEIPMYMLGRYFGYYHYMSQLHPYSTAIFLNKKEGKSYYRKFDDIFASLFICAVERIQKTNEIDGVLAVPVHVGRDNRFEKILEIIAKKCNIENLEDYLKCVKDYPTQKVLSSLERQDNIADAFKGENYLRGKNIIIIDDIITTGATIRECIRTLKYVGVNQVFVVVLGINQLQGNYWSSDVAQVTCSNCGKKMHLLINSKQKTFFYSCYQCNRTLDFEMGRNILCNNVNSEII